MLKSIKNIAKLSVSRGNPADVDGRTPTLVFFFLTLVLLESATYWVMGWLSAIDSSPSFETIVNEVFRVLGKICGQLFVALCIYAVLHVRNVPQNFRQTFASYLGVSIVIALVSVVVVVAAMLISSHNELDELFNRRGAPFLLIGTVYVVISVIYFVSVVWKVLAIRYVLYKTMEIKFWQGAVLAIMLICAPQAVEIFSDMFKYMLQSIGYAVSAGFF